MVVFPSALHITGHSPSYIVVAPYISAGKSRLLKPAVQNGALILVIYKAAGGFETEVFLVVIVSLVCLKRSDIYLKN